jgi:hypothetical protein
MANIRINPQPSSAHHRLAAVSMRQLERRAPEDKVRKAVERARFGLGENDD